MRQALHTVALAGALIALSGGAQAQMGYHEYRHIHVNGDHLNAQQVLELDRTLGYQVPSGFYWVNFQKGSWGYEGNSETLGSIFRADDPRRLMANQREQQQQQRNSGQARRPYINNDTGTGGGVINPNKGGCSYVSAGGTTVRVCD